MHINPYIITILVALLTACSNTDECDYSFGSPLEVKAGETYCLPDGSSLKVIEITSSYCPCNVDCIWEGEATIEALRSSHDGSSEAVLIHEKVLDQNPEWATISDIFVTEGCTPAVASIKITITE